MDSNIVRTAHIALTIIFRFDVLLPSTKQTMSNEDPSQRVRKYGLKCIEIQRYDFDFQGLSKRWNFSVDGAVGELKQRPTAVGTV